MVDLRFLTGFRQADTDSAGLVQELDGTVWLVQPDGDRVQITGGGGTGLPAWWDVDTGQEVVLIQGTLSILTDSSINTLDIVNNSPEASPTEPNVRLCATIENMCRANIVLLTEPDEFDAPHVTSKIVAQVVAPDGSTFANLELGITMDGSTPVSSFQIDHDLVSFSGAVEPIERPVVSLSSPTLAADVANALADLGLISVVA